MFLEDMPADDMGGAATPPVADGEEQDGEKDAEKQGGDEMGGGATM